MHDSASTASPSISLRPRSLPDAIEMPTPCRLAGTTTATDEPGRRRTVSFCRRRDWMK
jgi:hypothetical protein